MLDKSLVSQEIENLSAEEVARFDKLAQQWWDPNGKYKTALAFNQARLGFINQQIEAVFGDASKTLDILDVGCGGGLISEPLAAQGHHVLGIDPSATSIEVAKRHALSSGVDVTYQHGLADKLQATGRQFDVVVNAEVVEHVPDQQALIEQCCKLVRPGGVVILATLNRTLLCYFIAILGAEYVLRYLPVGTHSWRKFVKPEELLQWCPTGFSVLDKTGLKLNPFTGKWSLTNSLQVNYVLSIKAS